MTKLTTSSKNKLIVNRLNLQEGTQKISQELIGQDLDIPKIIFSGPIVLNVELFKNSDTIVASGTVNYKVILCCVNCLKDFERAFSEKIYQEYIKSNTSSSVVTSRLEEVDFIREYYTSDFFDLTALIRDTILLSIPLAPWCQNNCPGVKE